MSRIDFHRIIQRHNLLVQAVVEQTCHFFRLVTVLADKVGAAHIAYK